MPYTLPSWQDSPSTATPISASNLTQANTAINSIDSRLTTTETGKLSSGLVNAQGKLISADNTGTPTALLVGANGQVLTADNTATTGLKWATPATGGGVASVTRGDTSITVAGTGTNPTVAINASGTASSATFLRGDRTWATPAGGSAPPGYVTVSRNGGTSFDQNVWQIPASPGFSYYYIDISTNTDGNGAIISIKDPPDPTKQTEITICVQQNSVGGQKWDVSPSTIAWEDGKANATGIFQPSRWDIGPGVITIIKLTWMGTNIGYLGRILGSIPPYYYPLAQNPTSWAMTQGVTAWAGVNNQSIITPVYFMRGVTAAVREWFYNALCHFCSAAMRTRLSNNSYVVEIGTRFNSDGPRGAAYRGGIEGAGGYSASSPQGGFITGGAFTDQAGAIGLIAHEMAHGISANYYGGNNPHPGSGIGNGSEPDLISQHSTLVTLQNDCINNGNGSTFSDEWFAEMLRGMRVSDNGTVQPVTGSPASAVGPNTNAGPGGTGGTPQQRADRFVTYINSLGLV